MEKDVSMLVIGIVCCLVVLMLVRNIADVLANEAKERKKSGRTQAKIVRIDEVRRTIVNQGVFYEPVLVYMVEGCRYKVRYDKGGGASGKYRLGDMVTIWYNELSPEDIYIPEDDGRDTSLIPVWTFGIIAVAYMAAIALCEYFFGVNLRFW